MAVITSRQPGLRPETIRTRLARFMPSRTSSGWSVSWSAHNEHADDIADEHELQAAEHLGCYGVAVAHSLAQAELTPQRLRVNADSTINDDGMTVMTIEVRAQIIGPAVDQDLFDAIIRRAEPSCPVIKGLATQVSVRLIAILDDTLAAPAAPAANSKAAATTPPDKNAAAPKAKMAMQPVAAAAETRSAPMASAKTRPAVKSTAVSAHAARAIGAQAMHAMTAMRGTGMTAPKWLTTRMAVLMVIAFGALAAVPVMWSVPA